MHIYEMLFTTYDQQETMKILHVQATSQVDAMDKLRAQLIDAGQVVDFVFSASRVKMASA